MIKTKESEKLDESTLTQLQELDPQLQLLPQRLLYLYYEENVLYAYVIVNKQKKVFLERIFVHPEKRRQGLAQQLLLFVEEDSIQKGREMLIVPPSDEKSLNTILTRARFIQKNSLFWIRNFKEHSKKQKKIQYIFLFSFLLDSFIGISKIGVGIFFHSQAVFVDGFHSFSDSISSLGLVISSYYANRPADEEHPFGHERIEAVSIVIIGTLLAYSSLGILISNILPSEPSSIPSETELPLLKIVMAIAITLKMGLFFLKIFWGKRLKSASLLADAAEHKADITTSLVVFFGLFGLAYWPFLDTILAALIGVLIFREALSMIWDSVQKLLDKQDLTLVKEIREDIESFPEISHIHGLRLKYSGSSVFAFCELRVHHESLLEAHAIIHRIEEKLKKDFPQLKEILIHSEPYEPYHSQASPKKSWFKFF